MQGSGAVLPEQGGHARCATQFSEVSLQRPCLLCLACYMQVKGAGFSGSTRGRLPPAVLCCLRDCAPCGRGAEAQVVPRIARILSTGYFTTTPVAAPAPQPVRPLRLSTQSNGASRHCRRRTSLSYLLRLFLCSPAGRCSHFCGCGRMLTDPKGWWC